MGAGIPPSADFQLHRDLPRQLAERPNLLGELGQLHRDLPRQLISVEAQPPQLGELGQLRRDLPRQLIAVEAQRPSWESWDSSAGISPVS